MQCQCPRTRWSRYLIGHFCETRCELNPTGSNCVDAIQCHNFANCLSRPFHRKLGRPRFETGEYKMRQVLMTALKMLII